MSSWEYKVVTFQRGVEIAIPPRVVGWEDPIKLLNQMSQEGWELVSVVAYPDLIGGPSWWKEYYFRRPVSQSQT